MKSAAQLGAQRRQAGEIGMPFIGLEIPFVCHRRPYIRPFIGNKKPFVKKHVFSGFTLIELIVTVVIAGILMALAAPSFSNFVKNNRLTTQANDMIADLALARSEAVKRATTITVCKSTNGLACNAGANWGDGWIVVNTASGQVFRAHEALTGQNTMVGTGGGSSLTDQIVYTRTGIPTIALGGPQQFHICDALNGPVQGRLIQVASTGRARIAIDATTSRPLPPPSC